MDINGLLFIAVIVILSGFIAYWGDNLGRKIGKSRKTIGKLRPRHTAMLITAGAGSVASLLSILVMTLVSEPIRVMLFQGDQVRRQLQESQQELVGTRQALDSERGEVSRVQAELVGEQQKLAATAEERDRIQKEADTLRSQSDRLREDVADIRSNLELVRSNLQTAQADLSAVTTNRDAALDLNQELAQQNLALDQQVQEGVRELAKVEAKLASLTQELADVRKATDDQLAAAGQESQRARDELAGIQADLAKAQKDLTRAQEELVAAQADLATTQKAIDAAETLIGESRIKPLIVGVSDELARVPVPSTPSEGQLRGNVLQLLRVASIEATRRGAAPSEPNGEPAGLVSLTFEGTPLSPTDQVDALVRQNAGRGGETVLIARSIVNVFEGEFVPIAIEIRANPVVYTSGERIAVMNVDGRMRQSEIFQQIAAFVRETLSQRALSDGMIPARGQDTALGEIGSEALIEVVQAVAGTERTVRLAFHASRTTRAADRLALDLRLG